MVLFHSTKNPKPVLIELNSLITKYAKSHQFTKALQLFNKIHSSHALKPDHYTFSSTLTACTNLRDTTTGDQLHAQIINAGYKTYPHVYNTLISLYAKSNDLNSVNKVFYEITRPDVYTWTTLLSGYTKMGLIERAYELLERSCQRDVTVWNAVITGCVENGHGNIAVDMFIRMHRDGVKHDNYTFASVLSMCGASERLGFGRQVHSLVVQTGYVVMVSAVNALVTMYFNCGLSNDACEIFQKAKAVIICNQVTYNAMISGLVNQGRDMEAVIMFLEMREACFEPTEATLVSVFSLCMDGKMVNIGRQVHGVVIEMGFEAWTSLSNAVITMYSNYGDLGSACRVFEILQEKDIISWNSMIVGYAERSDFMSAITTYLQMQVAGMQPDDFTVCSLLTCSELRMSQNIHGLVSKNGLKLNPEVCNALVSAFSKHGEFEHAYKIFREKTVRNLISWNSILSGCVFNRLPLWGLEIFRNCTMSSSEEPDTYTLSIVLSICSCISSIRTGKQVHGYILKSEFGSEIPLGNALITWYVKCVVLEWSSKI